MSLLTSLPRFAVRTSVKAARLPIDTAYRLAGRRPAAVDAVDATVKDAAGGLLGDRELSAEATRTRTAADQRRRADALDGAATDATLAAEQDAARETEDAERQAAAAREDAEARSRSAAESAERRKEAAAKAERQRKQKAKTEQKKAEKKIAEKERKQRLEQLDREAGALAEREEALTAADEANRLSEAAARAREQRKS